MAKAVRTPRAPKPAVALPVEADALANASLPRETNAIIGHEAVRATLADGLRHNPPTGLLLLGERGIGKASMAFVIAKALMRDPRLPDGVAATDGRDAALVAAGTHPAVRVLSRRYDEKRKKFGAFISVDSVREIGQFLAGTAANGGWRVVIVDAADDLNPSAANALLKRLEEPPPRALFIVIAHSPAAVLPTIRSRCRLVRMRPLAEAEVAAVLQAHGADAAMAGAAGGSARAGFILSAAGGDVVARARALMSVDALREARKRHALADLAAERREGQFAIVLDIVLAALAERVRTFAGRVPADVLDAYASAYLDATLDRPRVEVFNLDRKEFALALVSAIAAADRRLGRS